MIDHHADDPTTRRRAGWIAATIIAALYGGLAFTIDVPKAAMGFKSDEATYYTMAYSLAFDGDLAYRREDLVRVYREFPTGPAGIFLKKGKTVSGVRFTAAPPFLKIIGSDDPRAGSRLFFGKSFIYPLVAAPFVRLLGTNGFLVLHALLLTIAFLAAYTFLSARSGTAVSLILAGAFLWASVVPVYVMWIMPELFNFTLAVGAYFLWLYKFVAPSDGATHKGWLYGSRSDLLAAVLIGVATFSKVSNILLIVPLVAWWCWKRQWRLAIAVAALCAVVTAGLFAVNIAVTGDWNYQGEPRNTYYDQYPFQREGLGFDVGADRSRTEALGSVMFDREVFWTNLKANLWYFFVGRYSGVVAYFFPAIFAGFAFLLARGRREPWQWYVLVSVVAQMLLFIVTQPYTYFGSGGSLGNRYFIAGYGMCVFLLPPLRSVWLCLLPWVVGGLFVGKLVLNPFYSLVQPWEPMKSGPFRLLPVELTNVNDIPINNDRRRAKRWLGGITENDRAFQVYLLDDGSWLPEDDKSVWMRGRDRAEILIKVDRLQPERRPLRQLQLTLSAGPVPVSGVVRLKGSRQQYSLQPNQAQTLYVPLGAGFPYKMDREFSTDVFLLSISSDNGFVPFLEEPGSQDTRYLGVHVLPMILP